MLCLTERFLLYFLLIETKTKSKPTDFFIKQCKVVLSRSEVNDNQREKKLEKPALVLRECKIVLSRCESAPKKSMTVNDNDSQPEIQVKSSPYTLRRSQRKIPEKTVPEDKKHEHSKQVSTLITPTQMTNILWRSMVVKGFAIEVGMLVCAKMNTYWPWPARVIGLFRKKARVKFFGDLREGSVDLNACVPFYNCQGIILNYINIIDEKTKQSFKQNFIDDIEKPRNNIQKKISLKELYLQAVRDVELCSGKKESFILSIL